MHSGLKGGMKRPVRIGARPLALWLMVLTASLTYLAACAGAGAASAETAFLCTGYSGCSSGSFTTHGYEDNEYASWWRMYPGDNCTNYAAYVESQVYGVTTPDYLLGDAYEWSGNAAAHGVQVDSTPGVGAVAAWSAQSPGMSGYGHVAVVEDVGPDDSYIDVSQSGMGDSQDGYDWERIYPNQASWEPWPTDFIHFTGTRAPVAIPQPGMRMAAGQIAVAGS